MRVLFVTPSYFPIVGGSEVLTRTLATKLEEIGIHADIMTFNMNEKWRPVWAEDIVQDGCFKLFRMPALNPLPNLPNPLSSLFKVNVLPKISFVKKFRNYDIVHFVSESDLSFAIFSLFVKKPKLFQFLGIYRRGGMYKYYKVDRPFMGIILQRLLPKLADVFIISSAEEKQLLLDMRFPEEKIFVLPIGVDTEMFHPDRTMKTDNLLLFVGRIERIKGLHILMEALKYINIPINLVVVGPRWDKEYAIQIEKMASAINKKGCHKVFFLGSLNQKELVKWYQKASLLICPYLVETYSNVVRESLACETPVVSTGSHIIEGGHDGILLTSAKPKDLADSIAKLLKDKDMREKLGREGRVLVSRYFTWQHVIKELTRLYVNVINTQQN